MAFSQIINTKRTLEFVPHRWCGCCLRETESKKTASFQLNVCSGVHTVFLVAGEDFSLSPDNGIGYNVPNTADVCMEALFYFCAEESANMWTSRAGVRKCV